MITNSFIMQKQKKRFAIQVSNGKLKLQQNYTAKKALLKSKLALTPHFHRQKIKDSEIPLQNH